MKFFWVPLILAACSSGPPPRPVDLPDPAGPDLPTPPPRRGYSLTIVPSMVTRQPGEAQQFRVIAQGGDVDVRWSLSGPGDFSTWGTIDERGLYRAPAKAPAGPVRIVADIETRGRRIGTVSALVSFAAETK